MYALAGIPAKRSLTCVGGDIAGGGGGESGRHGTEFVGAGMGAGVVERGV